MNKTRVNLYLSTLKPKKELFTLPTVSLVWLLSFLVFWGGEYFLINYQKDVEKITKQLQKDEQQQQQQRDKLKQQHSERRVSAALEEKLALLQEELRGKKGLALHLKDRSLPKEQFYSQIMQDIAKYHDPEMALTSLRLQENDILIEGMAIDAAVIPRWLNTLQESDYFSGKHFGSLNISVPGLGPDDTTASSSEFVTFRLNTKVEIQ